MSLTLGERILAGAVVFGALLFAIASVTFWSSDRYACPVPSTGNLWKDEANPEECRLLRRFPDLVRRDGDQLIVTLVSGESKIFRDYEKENCGLVDCKFYVLESVARDDDVVLIWSGMTEGSDNVLLDRQSGAELTVADFPERSPDGSYWAVVDGGASFGSNQIQFIRHENGQFNVVGAANRELCGFLRWDGAPVFMMVCLDRHADRAKEYRVAPDLRGGLIQIETGRRLTSDEEDLAFYP